MAHIVARRGPSGRTVYQVQIRIKGYPRRTCTFDRISDARRWAAETEAAMRAGRFLDTSEAEQTTLGELLTRYRNEVVEPKGRAQEVSRLNRWIRDHPLRDRSLARLRPMDFAAWRDERLRQVKPGTVCRELAIIRRAIRHGMNEWGMHLNLNPLDRVSRPTVDDARERRLYDGEEDWLLAACRRQSQPGRHGGRGGQVHRPRSPYLVAFLLIALDTGMRRGEILALRWSNLDRKRRVITLPAEITKTRTGRSVPLSPRVMAELDRLPRAIDGRIIPMEARAASRAIERVIHRARQNYEQACKREGIKPDPGYLRGLRLHDLRHEAVSRLFEAGLNPMQVASISGHKDLRMLARYTHLDAADLGRQLWGDAGEAS